MTCSTVTSSKTFIAGSADGRIVAFTNEGDATPLSGEQHSGYVSGITSTPNSTWSVGYDDRVRTITSDLRGSSGMPTTSQPKAVAAGGDDLAFVAESNSIEVFKNGSKVSTVSIKYEAVSVAVSAAGIVAVGAQVRLP